MKDSPLPSPFWIHWLSAVALGVVGFGLALVVAPGFARQGFALLVYATPEGIDRFGPEAARYASLAHAVIGSLMVGWGSAMVYAVRALLARGLRVGWNLVALSVAAWFVPDTAYSLGSGYWQNAVLNAVFLFLFAVPLWATRKSARAGLPGGR
jgi:hypothetical protein